MKHRLPARPTLAVLALTAIALATPSCRSPVNGSGGAALALTVGGVVVPAVARLSVGDGRREGVVPKLIVPSVTSTVRVVAVEPSGLAHERIEELATPAAPIELAGLPAGVELSLTVEARAADGSVVTAWNGTQALSQGPNELSVTLSPPAGAVRVLTLGGTAAELPRRASKESLARGAVRFDEVAGLPAGLEAQLLYDTDRAEYAWLAAYDSSWAPLPLIASDQAKGWVVVTVPADGIVRTAVANVASSPGYPERTVSGGLHVRQAFFCAPSGGGGGRHHDPALLVEGNVLTARNGWSVFLREGTYTLTTTLTFDDESLYLYGGFPASGWDTRSAATYPSVLQGAASNSGNAVAAVGSVDCRLDGLTILGRSFELLSWGLNWDSGGRLIVSDCAIKGGTLNSGSSSGATRGITIGSSSAGIEIADSLITGGSVTAISIATTQALYVSGSGTSLYLHSSDLDAGSVTTSAASSTTRGYGLQIDGGAVVAAGCRIWGGVAINENSTNTTESRGIYHQGTAQRLYLSSSLVSGGAVNSINYQIAGVYCFTDTLATILGCTVDGGLTDPTTGTSGWSSAVRHAFSDGVPNAGRIQASVLLSSSPAKTAGGADIQRLGLRFDGYSVNIARVSGSSFFAAGAGLWGGSTPMTALGIPGADVAQDNAGDAAALASSQFRSYAAAPRTFADFLAVDWRPAAGATYVGSSSGENGFSEAGLTAQLLADYPALGLDLAGRPRPATGPWARGAYEP